MEAPAPSRSVASSGPPLTTPADCPPATESPLSTCTGASSVLASSSLVRMALPEGRSGGNGVRTGRRRHDRADHEEQDGGRAGPSDVHPSRVAARRQTCPPCVEPERIRSRSPSFVSAFAVSSVRAASAVGNVYLVRPLVERHADLGFDVLRHLPHPVAPAATRFVVTGEHLARLVQARLHGPGADLQHTCHLGLREIEEVPADHRDAQPVREAVDRLGDDGLRIRTIRRVEPLSLSSFVTAAVSRLRRRSSFSEVFTAMRYSHERTPSPGSIRSAALYARMKVSCATSSAACCVAEDQVRGTEDDRLVCGHPPLEHRHRLLSFFESISLSSPTPPVPRRFGPLKRLTLLGGPPLPSVSMADIIDGKKIAEEIFDELRDRIAVLKDKGTTARPRRDPRRGRPGLGDLRPPQGTGRAEARHRGASPTRCLRRPRPTTSRSSSTRSTPTLRSTGSSCRPRSRSISTSSTFLRLIDPMKDVDGLHPVNQGLLMRGEPRFISCTPYGVQQLLVRSGIEIAGQHVVVVGRSVLVGRPLSVLLSNKADAANATVTLCHTGTRDLARYTKQADILVAAAGSPGMITVDHVSEGAVVIDVGTTPNAEGRLVGDVDFDAVSQKVRAITPVPGGVGPMTRAMLMANTVMSAERSRRRG